MLSKLRTDSQSLVELLQNKIDLQSELLVRTFDEGTRDEYARLVEAMHVIKETIVESEERMNDQIDDMIILCSEQESTYHIGDVQDVIQEKYEDAVSDAKDAFKTDCEIHFDHIDGEALEDLVEDYSDQIEEAVRQAFLDEGISV